MQQDLATIRVGTNDSIMPDFPRESFFVGVDVGTGSARAGVFDKSGNMKESASAPIQLWKPAADYVEQSSDDICGGGLKNEVLLREHANITGCELVLPKEPEAVLLGAAILGAVASEAYPDILDAMKSMNAVGKKNPT
jgi:ribulose kinase